MKTTRMKTIRPSLILAAALASALALSACGKRDESASPIPGTPPPSASAPTMAPAPASTAGMAPAGGATSAAVTLNTVELGSTVDANNKILASGTSFAPKDTIYASVDTSGSGTATVAAKWTYQDGQTVHEDSKTLNANGPQTTAFMISKPGGLPAGSYKVDISLNGNQVASKDFTVK
jgi:hypothetical protein